MEDIEKYKELIPAYLAGKIGSADRAALEAKLKESQQLQNELAELKQLQMGLTALEAASAGHIDSQLLARYAADPGELDEEIRKEIEDHIESCDECREELLISRPVVSRAAVTAQERKRSLVLAWLKWLVSPRLAVRPVYGLIALVVLALPIAYLGLQDSAEGMAQATYEIIPAGARDLRSMNDIVIRPDVAIVQLRFMVPVLDDCVYDFELYDADDRLVLARYDNPPQKSFDLKLRGCDLVDGTYTLRVKELKDKRELDTFRFRLNVRHTQN